jgi:hypothetical protein
MLRPLTSWSLVLSLAVSIAASEEPSSQESQDTQPQETVVVPLPLSPLATAGPVPLPINPPTAEEIEAAISRGVRFLLDDQNENGSWGSATRTKGLNIYAPIPGAHHAFRAGTTGLAVMALAEYAESGIEAHQADVLRSLDRADVWLRENLPQLRRANTDALYNVWGHAYGIQALVRLHNRSDVSNEDRGSYQRLIAEQIDLLARYETVNGGWGYYDFEAHTQRPSGSPTSFTTATVLIALDEARDAADVEVPERLVERAITSIRRQQKPDFSYAYGEYLRMMPMHPVNRPGGSLGRSQACNLALRRWGSERVTDEVLKTWLNRLLARNGWLSIGRKRPVPHESHFAVAGYFYYYGHLYAAMCVEELSQPERPFFQGYLAHILLPLQEADGSWWDYPLYDYHQPYGTSMAVLSLLRCRPETTP